MKRVPDSSTLSSNKARDCQRLPKTHKLSIHDCTRLDLTIDQHSASVAVRVVIKARCNLFTETRT